MATRVVSLLEMIASRGGIVKTTNAPGAWAVIAQWRRYFELKGEDADEEEYAEEFKRAFEVQLEKRSEDEQQKLEETILAPIADPGVVEARKYFAMEYLRSLTQESSSRIPTPPTNTLPSGPTAEERNAQAERILNNPDLRIPAGDEFLHLA
eukprot:CAMPEP_0113612396 /NCGR_PEP_ID=MMETSP0017_2-20120614/6078_1 /TAXON_ID=2856 /ORGANISM="Cylindrotheca closterium" /LENGTH=151 /DNA_ID=CAMNT_0000521429 /DNA_START=87 /DNA_END=538 /DNA_ORIENTATION=- /assembly_acc=CAM_ASM_000147